MHWIVSLFIAIYVCVWSVMSGVCWLLANNYAMHTRPFINDIITHKYTCSRVQPANDKPRFRLYIFDLFSESRCRNHLFIFRWPFCPLYGVCVACIRKSTCFDFWHSFVRLYFYGRFSFIVWFISMRCDRVSQTDFNLVILDDLFSALFSFLPVLLFLLGHLVLQFKNGFGLHSFFSFEHWCFWCVFVCLFLQ